MSFKEDRTMLFGGKQGTWKVNDDITLVVTLNSKDNEFTFNTDLKEATLVKPLRNPPSKMKL